MKKKVIFEPYDEMKIAEFAEKISHYYQLFNWKWADLDGGQSIPDKSRILRQIYSFIDQVPECKSISSGGIIVEYDEDFEGVTVSWSLDEVLYL